MLLQKRFTQRLFNRILMPVGIAFEKNFIASLSSLDSTFLIVKNNSYDFFLFERQSMCVEST